MAIDKAKITLYQGNYSVYAAAKAGQDAFEVAENTKLRHEIGRLKATAAEKGRWGASREKSIYGNPKTGEPGATDRGFASARAARQMRKEKNLEHRMNKEIEAKSQLLKNIEDVPALTINTSPDHHDTYLEVQNLVLNYDGSALFAPVTFTVHRGDRVALVGPNGSGKSSLLHALLGTFSGEMVGRISYPPALSFSLTRQMYADNTGTLKKFAAAKHLDYQALLNNLKKLGLERDAFTTPIEHLSMGQQKKVELARSLVTPANLLVWDEPLNYLDLYNQDQLTTSILAYQPTMLFVEHDQDFIAKVATQVIQLRPWPNPTDPAVSATR